MPDDPKIESAQSPSHHEGKAEDPFEAMKLPRIDEALIRTEITTEALRGTGPGGQNKNKRETKIRATFDVDASKYLTHEQKEAIKKNLGRSVIVKEYQGEREQGRNLRHVVNTVLKIVMEASIPPKERLPTKVPRSQKKTRLAGKKIHSAKKGQRRGPQSSDFE